MGADWSRYRELVGGAPSEYVSFGTVGHASSTPQYIRLEDGRVLVEVTLTPSGDEIVAQLACGAGSYIGIPFGARVVVGIPGGSSGTHVILGMVCDLSSPWVQPTTPTLVTTATVPLLGILRTPTGQHLLLESGVNGDILVRSGGSIQLQADSGEQILLTGRVHLGAGAQPSSQAVPLSVGEGGQQVDGQGFGAYTPAPATNLTIPPPTAPADGIVRVKDAIQSNALVDPDFWAWVIGVSAAAGYGPVPTTLTSLPASGSKCTASDA